MNWLKRFFGLYDKKQARKTKEVMQYVKVRNADFEVDMEKLKKDSKKMHNIIRESHEEAVELNRVARDLTSKIAIVTGSLS